MGVGCNSVGEILAETVTENHENGKTLQQFS